MNERPIPPIPDEPTRRRLRENLRAAAAELRKSSEEFRLLQEMFDRDYEQSPVGQLHARWEREKARLQNGTRAEQEACGE
jgi:diketogulonate reductase-like aldo/keto reductase